MCVSVCIYVYMYIENIEKKNLIWSFVLGIVINKNTRYTITLLTLETSSNDNQKNQIVHNI